MNSLKDKQNKYKEIKKIIKKIYKISMNLISPKIKAEGDIMRISPDDGMEYFFGYYDKSPWDATDRYMLSIRVKNSYKSAAPEEEAEIILFDTHNNNKYRVLGKTKSWNVQQGCMLQWLGPDYSERIIYNDYRNDEYCSVILNIRTNEEKVISMPIYTVASNGKFALSLDFSRLHRLRRGYGYSNKHDNTKDEKCPNKTCIWHIDLESGEVKELLKYTDLTKFEPRSEMKEAEHKVNHIMISPSGKRFMVLHRWFNGSRKYTRLITGNIDGTELYNLNDDDMTSHCYWKNDEEILAYARKKDTGNGYYIMEDRTNNYRKVWNELSGDGHPSYSPNGKMIVTDTYPDKARVARLYCIEDDKINNIAKVYAPFKYDNDVRCDLHPRWSRKGDKICFDSVFEGRRGLYIVCRSGIINE